MMATIRGAALLIVGLTLTKISAVMIEDGRLLTLWAIPSFGVFVAAIWLIKYAVRLDDRLDQGDPG